MEHKASLMWAAFSDASRASVAAPPRVVPTACIRSLPGLPTPPPGAEMRGRIAFGSASQIKEHFTSVVSSDEFIDGLALVWVDAFRYQIPYYRAVADQILGQEGVADSPAWLVSLPWTPTVGEVDIGPTPPASVHVLEGVREVVLRTGPRADDLAVTLPIGDLVYEHPGQSQAERKRFGWISKCRPLRRPGGLPEHYVWGSAPLPDVPPEDLTLGYWNKRKSLIRRDRASGVQLITGPVFQIFLAEAVTDWFTSRCFCAHVPVAPDGRTADFSIEHHSGVQLLRRFPVLYSELVTSFLVTDRPRWLSQTVEPALEVRQACRRPPDRSTKDSPEPD